MNNKNSIEATRKGFETSFAEGRYYNQQTKDDDHMVKIEAFVKIEDGMKVLDLGCGTGFMTFPLAKHNENAHVTGLDIVKETLKRNTEKSKEEGISNIEFVAYDGEKFPFEDDTFDVVVTRYVLHHFPDINAGIKEVARVLKKGGKFFISDPRPNDNDETRFVDAYMQMKKDGHIRFYSKNDWKNICGENNMKMIDSFDTSIRFPRKKSTAIGFDEIMKNHDKSIVDTYNVEVRNDEIWITEQVNNIMFEVN